MKDDEGTSLVEVLIALAIMGIASTAILGALATQLAGTRAHRDQSNAATVVTSAAEQVKLASYDHSCGTSAASSYTVAARSVALPSDWTAKNWTTTDALPAVTIRYWDGANFSATCHDNETGDSAGLLRLQEVVLIAQGPEGDAESLTVLKAGPPQ